MMARSLLAAALAIVCLLASAGTALAQSKGCSVEQAPPLDFGRPGANPTAEVVTSTALRVRCTGVGAAERGMTIKVCVKLDGPTPIREMVSGASALGYQIRGNSPNGPVIALNQTADALLTLDQSPQPTGTVTIPLYGLITAGQMGLVAGTYTEAIRGEVRSTTTPPTDCAPAVQATFNMSASAILPGSCSIVADDLAFGSHSSLAGGVNAAAGVRLTCTTNTAWSVGIDGGGSGNPDDRRMRRNAVGPEWLGYGLFRDAGRTQAWGNTPATTVRGVGTGQQVALTAYGRVPEQPMPLSGDYRDTVVVTVEY